jgi:hypothetical protein
LPVSFSSEPWSLARHADVDRSIAVASWRVESLGARRSEVTLWLVCRERWPHDMGLELGWGPLSRRADRDDPAVTYAFLPFDGLFNPVHVRRGEVARTKVVLEVSRDEVLRNGLYFGARRVDGSRLHQDAPHWTRLDEPSAVR